MADALLSVAIEVAKCLVAPLRPRCSYVTSYDSYVRQLEREAKKLDKKREEMKNSIDDAENSGKMIKVDVKDWTKDAETDANEALRVLHDNETAKKTCFYGWLPNPRARYRLGREARRIAERIQERMDLIPSGNVYDGAAPGLVDPAPPVIFLARDSLFQSRDSILRNIMSALDDEKNKVIGIHGPGGVGKTTLLETVEKKLRIEKRPFHMIAKAKVSQAPDLKQIQLDIAHALGLNLKDEPHEDKRRDLLLKRFHEDPSKKVLVILDDLWKELDLGAVGIPSGDKSSGCQVLLTSRDEQVLRKTGAPLRFRLEGLSTEEAFILFEKTYGDDLKNNEGLKEKAVEVVAKLAGLPLLINSVATTLKSDESNESDVSKLETALTIIKDSDIKAIVEWSYGHLEREETKSLFLLCGFIGGSIPVELLLGLGMGLGLFGRSDMTIQTSRNRLSDMLRRLRSICLLQDGGDDKKCVIIHDVYSEEVISTPLTGQNSLRTHHNAGSWPKEKLEKCWVCLVNVGSDRLAKLRLHWFPGSKIFMLSKQHDKRDCNGLDFTSMKELRVLYLYYINFTSIRSSVKILKNLQSLYLDNCDVEDVAILGELKALQILSFAGSSISYLPQEIGELTKLKLLNLTKCYSLRKIEPGVLKGLTNLEELYMWKSFDEWMGEDEISSEDKDEISSKLCNAKLAELKSLTKLSTLEISIPDPTVLLKDGDLPFGNLIRFSIRIGNVKDVNFEGLTAMMLNLKGYDSIFSKEWVQKTLQKTQYLHLDGLREFKKKSANELCSQGFPKLKHLEIQNCFSIEHIVSSSNGAFPQLKHLGIQNCSSIMHIVSSSNDAFPQLEHLEIRNCSSIEHIVNSSNDAFPQLKHLGIGDCSSIKHIVSSSNGVFPLLESLSLQYLGNLEKICDDPECFGKLKAMRVTSCNRLEYIWCLSQMHRLAQLEKIEVHWCDSMRAIAFNDAREGIVVADNRIDLPNVHSLELAGLPKMMSFCIGAEITSDGAPIQVWFPRLESVEMVGLLDLEKILYGQPPVEYSNLKSIEIWDSKSMSSSILKSDWIVKLPNLESLKIESSPSAEVVFDLEELKVTGHVEILSRLTELWLSKLLNLQHMCKLENAQLRGISVFRKLQELYVSDTGLACLFPVSVAKCLREIRSIEVSDCEKMEALVMDEDGRDEGTNVIIGFPLLKRLDIINCPMIKSFSNFRGKKESVPIMSDSQDAYSDSFFDPKVSLPSLEELQFQSVRSFKSIWPRELPQSSFDNLAELQVCNCSELLNVFPSTITGRLPNLTRVEIVGCPSLETVFECGPLDSNTTEQTRVVPVSEAIRLSHVVMSNSQTVLALPNLEEVKVMKCPKLRYLFPYAVATTLEKLKLLEIEDCEHMKEVVAKEGGGQSKADVLTFPFLKSLSISQCPNFRAFILNPTSIERPSGEMAKESDESQQPLFSEMVTFPSLSKVKIGGVQVKELWSNQTRDDSFCKLRYLELRRCDNLQRIAPSHVWKRLRRSLEILEVKSCRLIEIIDEGDATVVETGPLRSLVLGDLENLRHIWQYDSLPNINVPFPNLKDIEVGGCPRLRMLFETFTASFLGQIEWLVVVSCDDMELIADHGECEGATCTTITFSELDALKLINMPKFRGYLPEKYHVEFPSHMRAFIRVDCGKEPTYHFNESDFDSWVVDRYEHRYCGCVRIKN